VLYSSSRVEGWSIGSQRLFCFWFSRGVAEQEQARSQGNGGLLEGFVVSGGVLVGLGPVASRRGRGGTRIMDREALTRSSATGAGSPLYPGDLAPSRSVACDIVNITPLWLFADLERPPPSSVSRVVDGGKGRAGQGRAGPGQDRTRTGQARLQMAKPASTWL